MIKIIAILCICFLLSCGSSQEFPQDCPEGEGLECSSDMTSIKTESIGLSSNAGLVGGGIVVVGTLVALAVGGSSENSFKDDLEDLSKNENSFLEDQPITTSTLTTSTTSTTIRATTTSNPTTTSSTTIVWASQDAPQKMKWQEAMNYCQNQGNSWRLPTKEELENLYKNRGLITNMRLDYYWSSTINIIGSLGAFYVDLSNGDALPGDKSYTLYVRCVRG